MQGKLFNKSSMERISSPEKLNDYIQVVTPGIWLTLAAALLLLASVCIWGFCGSISTAFTVKGLAMNGELVCFLNAGDDLDIREGMKASVSGDMAEAALGEVGGISATPLSYAEAANGIKSEYAVYALGLADWNIKLVIETDAPLTEGAIYTVSITTESLRPVDLMLR